MRDVHAERHAVPDPISFPETDEIVGLADSPDAAEQMDEVFPGVHTVSRSGRTGCRLPRSARAARRSRALHVLDQRQHDPERHSQLVGAQVKSPHAFQHSRVGGEQVRERRRFGAAFQVIPGEPASGRIARARAGIVVAVTSPRLWRALLASGPRVRMK